MLFGGKIIRVDVLDNAGKILISAEKDFIFPKNIEKNEDNIVIIKGKNLPEFKSDQIVNIVTTSKSNDRIKYMGKISVSLDNQLNIKLFNSSEANVLSERRRYYKVNVEEFGRVLYYIRDGKNNLFERPLSASITNINVGGIFLIVSNAEFMVGDVIWLELDLFVDYTLTVAAKVLRVQRDGDKIVGYGCEFQDLTAAQEDYIGRYIYKVQTERRLKEAKMEDKI